ncbi:MAG: 50S ribosomal protein L24 [Candidatus Wildermuthbacteria bacterium RIFCSPHIGHO2_12_FULL_40_12]|uniref:Large ribosomal subunit protein uL24 n=1 Tax=Candidatus Wildermuthbacteria bacterium RIFCSPHIGHO2_12_FULL_40_12 TaxID=1802457 RepID=A0A1G2RCP3_9BACT|nr:MAG: 50S ribosomal protein L24 [Candidatus Wildermuthbacteria bacterium RIFCSPHIGHO2_12_FULL_40_12]
MKIKKNDTVLIVAGKDRGKKGKVLQVFPKTRRIVVEGVNLRKKHVRPRRSGEKGQIVEMPFSFDASNAKVICMKCKEAVRIGYLVADDGKKYRVCRKCGQSQS